MPEGFEVYSELGYLQVDSKSPTLTFAYKATGTTGGAISFSSKSSLRIDIPASVISPVVAIRAYVPTCLLYVVNNGDGSKTFWYISNADVGGSIDYYVFDSVANYGALGTNAGLELYNAAGQVTFSTARGIAALHGYLSAPQTTVALTAGRQYAIVCGAFAGYRTQTVNGDPDNPSTGPTGFGQYPRIQDSQAWGVYVNNGFAGIDKCQFMSGPSGIAPDYNTPFHGAIVIDVTQYGGGAVSGNGAGGPGQITIPPPPIHQVVINPKQQAFTGTLVSRTFGSVTCSAKKDGNAIAATFNWYFMFNDGTWSFTGSSTGPTVTPRVVGVSPGDEVNNVIQCLVGIEGSSYEVGCTLKYTRTG